MWQPDLLKGKRQRPPRRPPAPERATHIALADILRLNAKPDWFWSHIPSGEYRPDRTGELLQRMGLKPGMFDFLFIDPQGRHYWLELKRGKLGRLSEAQEAFRARLEACHVPHAIALSLEGALAILHTWGALRDRVHLSA